MFGKSNSGLKGNQKRGETGRFVANTAARPQVSLKQIEKQRQRSAAQIKAVTGNDPFTF